MTKQYQKKLQKNSILSKKWNIYSIKTKNTVFSPQFGKK